VDGGSITSADNARAETRQALESSQMSGRRLSDMNNSQLGLNSSGNSLPAVDEHTQFEGRPVQKTSSVFLHSQRSVDESNLTQQPKYKYRDARTVVLSKSGDSGWGFSIVAQEDPHEGRMVNLVTKIQAGLPADRAGLQVNDRIFSLNGKNVLDADRLELVSMIQNETKITLVVRLRKKVKRRSDEMGPGASLDTTFDDNVEADAEKRAALEAMQQLMQIQQEQLSPKTSPSGPGKGNVARPLSSHSRHGGTSDDVNVETVMVTKVSAGLGIKLAEIGQQIFIDGLLPGGAADATKRLQLGDQILSADNHDLTTASLVTGNAVLVATGAVVTLVVRHQTPAEWRQLNALVRQGSITSTAMHATGMGGPPATAAPLVPLPALPEGEILTFQLRKADPKESFGVVISGGRKAKAKKKPKRVKVDNVIDQSIADICGVQVGDYVLAINGQKLDDPTHEFVISLIKQSDEMHLEVIRPSPEVAAALQAKSRAGRQSVDDDDGEKTGPARRPLPAPPPGGAAPGAADGTPNNDTFKFVKIYLEKGGKKLGMTIVGGQDQENPAKLMTVSIKGLVRDSPSMVAGVQPGDVVAAIDGIVMVGATRTQVIDVMKANEAFEMIMLRGIGGHATSEELVLKKGPADNSWGLKIEPAGATIGAPLVVGGVLVPSVSSRSGLFKGDYAVALNGQSVIGLGVDEFNTLLRSAGHEVKLQVVRPTRGPPIPPRKFNSLPMQAQTSGHNHPRRSKSDVTAIVADARITAELGGAGSPEAIDMLRRFAGTVGTAYDNEVPRREWNRLDQMKKDNFYKHDFTHSVTFSETNPKKNRYIDILAHEPTRVKLGASREAHDDYINANEFVLQTCRGSSMPGILSQGPLPDTVVDFWRMIVMKKSPAVVMVTSEWEGGRAKCHKYWPDPGSQLTSGDYTIECIGSKDLGHSISSDLVVSDKEGAEILRTEHVIFKSWPDHGVPEDPQEFLELVGHVREALDGKTEPPVIHCSAGVGRSGVLTVMLYIQEELTRLVATETPAALETMGNTLLVTPIKDIVKDLRQQRNHCVVQNLQQYEFIFVATQRLVEVFVRSIAVSERVARSAIEGGVFSPDSSLNGNLNGTASSAGDFGPPPLITASAAARAPLQSTEATTNPFAAHMDVNLEGNNPIPEVDFGNGSPEVDTPPDSPSGGLPGLDTPPAEPAAPPPPLSLPPKVKAEAQPGCITITLERPNMETSYGCGLGEVPDGTMKITGVKPNSPASEQLQADDVVLSVDEYAAADLDHAAMVRIVTSGLSVTFVVRRTAEERSPPAERGAPPPPLTLPPTEGEQLAVGIAIDSGLLSPSADSVLDEVTFKLGEEPPAPRVLTLRQVDVEDDNDEML
jgi:protein tyrosine phosphatase/C-terminal processing protease CtpA/Prc